MYNFDKSETDRKIRKDSYEFKYDMNIVSSKLKELYVDRQLSTNQIPEIFKIETGIPINSGKCYQIIKKMGLLRGKSESISLAKSTLDYSTSFLDDKMKGIIDGIVMGDGTMNVNENTKVARVSISGSKKEFIEYCKLLLAPYEAGELYFTPSSGDKDGCGTWTTCSKFHPDLYKIYHRWYNNKVKDVPEDVSFEPICLLLWYLGDGSLSSSTLNNSQSLYFSTNSFSRDCIERHLVSKFNSIGIEISRITSDNRLFLKTKSIVSFLQYIGGESPVKCYSYKFHIDSWRFKRTMKQASCELDLDYGKLANWVKNGFVKHSRSKGGKKVLFSEEEFKELSDRLSSGELSREKHKKALTRPLNIKNDLFDSQIARLKGESDEDYLDRMARIHIKNGFPYKKYSDVKLQKEWFGLVKSQYIIPDTSVIKYRRNGLSFADNFHQHIFSLNRKNKLSPLELFNDISKLKECLKKNNACNGLLTYAGLHSAICSDVRSPRLNNFPPLIARDLYNYYCEDGFNVLDPCAGFGGRLIGASVSKRGISYIGIDPSEKTYYGLVETQKFIKGVKPEFNSKIMLGCAEDELKFLRDDSFDFCFTSPPYFDTEEYSHDSTQSSVKFDEYELWRDKFLYVLIKEVYRVLKGGRIFAVNIGKFGRHNISEDIINMSLKIGFSHVGTKYIRFPIYGFTSSEKDFREEPLMVFKK